ncbi:hypothetical protein PDE_05343 [Penicillium oxalicum 114-2]|uniref:Uncharacterized protein n=1 Tax=Penicillium oxalicum (strain 114-2 / CGMCC 5302) TaxID=933388 RepID=S8B6U4_PENO1|nr:hypothetical protein PDE_05343 [Penicillium oxalicum 114-2]
MQGPGLVEVVDSFWASQVEGAGRERLERAGIILVWRTASIEIRPSTERAKVVVPHAVNSRVSGLVPRCSSTSRDIA